MRTTLSSVFAVALLLTAPSLSRAQWTSSYDFVNTAGDFNGFETLTPNMTLIANGVWQHYAVITNTPDFRFLFATELFTNTWKESNQADFDTPIAATAEVNTGNDIVVSNAAARTFRFTLDESSNAYTVQDVSLPGVATDLWINEVDYDNDGTDANEWIELVGPAGVSLNDYELRLISTNGTAYTTYDLAAAGFTFADEIEGYGFFTLGLIQGSLGVDPDYTPINWSMNEIVNTAGSSIQLRRRIGAINVHSISYDDNPNFIEDQVTPKDNNTSSNRTVRLVGGPGFEFQAFTWDLATGSSTPGAVNPAQSLIGRPIGAPSSVTIAEVSSLPALPGASETVTLQGTVTPQDGASNLTVTAFYRAGTIGPFSPIPMTGVGNTYTTDTPIPAQPAATVVQYYLFVSFEGLGTNSPALLPAAGPMNPQQYTVPTVTPGDVWLNELNYLPDPTDFGAADTNEYIELAGLTGSDIGDWRIELVDTAATYASYDIPPATLLGNDQSGFGFWVLGDSGIPAADGILDDDDLISGTRHIAKRGAIRLRDQFDQIHFEYSYGDPAPTLQFPDAIYIGFEDDFFAATDESLALVNTGSNYYDFAWSINTTATAGSANLSQTFVGGATNGTPLTVAIVALSRSGSTIEIQSTGTNTWAVLPEYSVDLNGGESQWSPINIFSNTFQNGINTTTFEEPQPAAPVTHYRIRQSLAGGPDAPTVAIVSLVRNGTDFQIVSTGTNTWTLVPEYSTDLVAGEPQWTAIVPFSNTYVDGTNTTTFAAPGGTAPFSHFRIRQTFP